MAPSAGQVARAIVTSARILNVPAERAFEEGPNYTRARLLAGAGLIAAEVCNRAVAGRLMRITTLLRFAPSQLIKAGIELPMVYWVREAVLAEPGPPPVAPVLPPKPNKAIPTPCIEWEREALPDSERAMILAAEWRTVSPMEALAVAQGWQFGLKARDMAAVSGRAHGIYTALIGQIRALGVSLRPAPTPYERAKEQRQTKPRKSRRISVVTPAPLYEASDEDREQLAKACRRYGSAIILKLIKARGFSCASDIPPTIRRGVIDGCITEARANLAAKIDRSRPVQAEKPPREPKPRKPTLEEEMAAWSDEQIAMAYDLYIVQGMSAAQVAAKMPHRPSRSAVIGIAHRKGWPKRGAAAAVVSARIGQRNGTPKTGRPRPIASAKAPIPKPENPKIEIAPGQEPTATPWSGGWPDMDHEIPQNARRVVMADLGAQECRWPLGDALEPGSVTTLFCAAPTDEGKSFCACHGARIRNKYQPTTKRLNTRDPSLTIRKGRETERETPLDRRFV